MRIKSMAKPSMAFAIIAALMLGLLAAPASAEKVKDKDGPVPDVEGNDVKDTGTLAGTATVGKLRTGCAHDGTSTVFGSGIGLPHQTKNAYYEIGNREPASVTSVTGKTGVLKACGRLTKMVSSAGDGLGAACGSSKGWDGKGTVSFPGTTKNTIWLKELGWKASVTTFIVTGTANQDATEHDSKKKTAEDVIVAAIQAQGAAPCTSKGTVPVLNPTAKTNDNNQGARFFTVNGTYTIANGTLPDQSATPATCKSGPPMCVNEPKKEGASG